VYFSLIVKNTNSACVNRAQIYSWDRQVLSKAGKVSCSRNDGNLWWVSNSHL